MYRDGICSFNMKILLWLMWKNMKTLHEAYRSCYVMGTAIFLPVCNCLVHPCCLMRLLAPASSAKMARIMNRYHTVLYRYLFVSIGINIILGKKKWYTSLTILQQMQNATLILTFQDQICKSHSLFMDHYWRLMLILHYVHNKTTCK